MFVFNFSGRLEAPYIRSNMSNVRNYVAHFLNLKYTSASKTCEKANEINVHVCSSHPDGGEQCTCLFVF